MPDLPARAGVIERQPVDAALRHRPDPFDDVVKRYTPRVTRIAYRITHNIDDARDVAQFVFMQMYVKSPEFEDQRAIESWLYVVTRNEALSVHRRRQRDDALVALGSSDRPIPGLEEIVIQNERERIVRATIASLPAAQRRLIELRHLNSMPTIEMAAQFGVPIARLKRDVERAKFRLRIEMRRRGLDNDVF